MAKLSKIRQNRHAFINYNFCSRIDEHYFQIRYFRSGMGAKLYTIGENAIATATGCGYCRASALFNTLGRAAFGPDFADCSGYGMEKIEAEFARFGWEVSSCGFNVWRMRRIK